MSEKHTHAVVRVARRDLTLASVRYRGLIPACALQDLGWRVSVSTGSDAMERGARVAVSVKPLTEREATWIMAAVGARVPVVIDLCDNIFVPNYGNQGDSIAHRFRAVAARAAAVSVPTAELRDVVIRETGLPAAKVPVIPDIVETQELLVRQERLLGVRRSLFDRVRTRFSLGLQAARRGRPPVLLWFGNHGATYASFGLTDLLLFAPALEAAASRYGAELWVVSNHRDRFKEISGKLRICARYFDWSPEIVDHALRKADVCLVPNNLDPFSRTKSANRALKALAAGVPVVATPTPAYAGLEKALWLDDPVEGISVYLSDQDVRRQHLQEARRVIGRNYSLPALQREMQQMLRLVLGGEAVA